MTGESFLRVVQYYYEDALTCSAEGNETKLLWLSEFPLMFRIIEQLYQPWRSSCSVAQFLLIRTLWFSLSPRQPLCLFLIASSLLTSALSIATGSLWRRALQILNKTLRINSSKMVQNKLKNSWIVNNMVLRRMISNQNKLA